MAVAVAMLVGLLVGCAGQSRVPVPRVEHGVLDARDWDFGRNGKLSLRGEWAAEGADGATEGVAMVPWGNGERRSSPELRERAARVRLIVPDETLVVTFGGEMPATSYALGCTNVETGRVTFVESGTSLSATNDPPKPIRSSSMVLIHGTSDCRFVTRAPPGAALAFYHAPSVMAPAMVAAWDARDNAIALALGTTLCLVLALAMAAQRRSDRVALLSTLWLAFWTVRTWCVAREALVSPEQAALLGEWVWFRLEFVTFWAGVSSFIRYVEVLSGERSPFARGVLPYGLIACSVSAFAGLDVINQLWLPTELVGLALVLPAFRNLVRARSRSRANRFALVGVLFTFVGGVMQIATIYLFGSTTTLGELLMAVEPIFQVVVLGVRAEDERIRAEALAKSTKRFVPQQFLEALGHSDVTTATLGNATSRRMTVLFTDIRGFTTLSEAMSPPETFGFLNACLSRLGPLVRQHNGFVDKYIGDAIMALFPREPSDAVRAATAMQSEVRRWNERHPESPPLAIGVGVHVGDVMMGTIGEAERFEATVISDAVNLTARLESLTKQLGCSVLISDDVYATLDPELRAHTRRLGTFVVKGKARPVTLYEVFASDVHTLRETKLRTRERCDAMLDAFANERVKDALAIAIELRDACPDDGPANWWFTRLVKEAAAGDDAVPSSRGIVRLDEK